MKVPDRSGIPNRNPFLVVVLIGLAILVIVGLVVAVIHQKQGDTAEYKQGYSYGYHHWDPNSFGYYDACDSGPNLLQTNTSWEDACTAGTDAARFGKGYNP